MREYVTIPTDLYIHKEDFDRMQKEGSEELAFVDVVDATDYIQVNKSAFQPGLRVDANTYKVTFIFK